MALLQLINSAFQAPVEQALASIAEAHDRNMQELERQITSTQNGTIYSIVNNITANLSDYLYLPGRNPGQILSSVNITNVPFTIKGFLSQTGNLTQWNDSANGLLANVTSAGYFSTRRLNIFKSNDTTRTVSHIYGSTTGTVWDLNTQDINQALSHLELYGHDSIAGVSTSLIFELISDPSSTLLGSWNVFLGGSLPSGNERILLSRTWIAGGGGNISTGTEYIPLLVSNVNLLPTVDLTRWYIVTQTEGQELLLSGITKDGGFYAGGTGTPDATKILIKASNLGIIQPLFRVENISAVRMFQVDGSGTVTISDTAHVNNIVRFQIRVPSTQTTANNIMQIMKDFAGNTRTLWSVGGSGTSVYGDTSADTGAIVRLQLRQSSAQSVNIFDVLNSATVALISVDSTGKLVFTNTAGATPLQIVNGAGVGKILTSDINGNASWQAAPTTYTDEQAQDAVGFILVDSATIDFVYTDATPSITAVVIPTFPDNTFTITGSVDATKLLRFEVDTKLLTGTTTILTVPKNSGSIACYDLQQTWSEIQTFDCGSGAAPLFSGPVDGTVQFFSFFDTISGYYLHFSTSGTLSGDTQLYFPTSVGGILITTSSSATLNNKALSSSCKLLTGTVSSGCAFADVTNNNKVLRFLTSNLTAAVNNSVDWQGTASRAWAVPDISGGFDIFGYAQTADKTIANTVTETTLIGTGNGSLTINANSVSATGTIFRFYSSGLYTVTGTPTITFKVKLGSTVLATTVTSALSGTNKWWEICLTLIVRTTGATGTIMMGGFVAYNGATYVLDAIDNGGSATTVDFTASKLFDVTVTWSAASASNTIKSTVCTFERSEV